MSKLRFFQSVLVEIPESKIMEHVYPIYGREFTVEDRIGKCPECDSNSWILLPEESCAVREGGKAYCECMNCGELTHL